MHREVETKLTVPEGFVLPDLEAVKGVEATEHTTLTLRATYWDTADLALARQGVTLRRRTGEGPIRWTLKLPTADSDGRWEVDVESRATAVPAALRRLLTPRLTGPLTPVVELTTTRTSRVLLAGARTLVDVVDDEVVATGGTGERWREVEVEVLTSRKVAARVVDLLTAHGAELGSGLSKAQRALGVVEERAPVVGPKDPASLLVHAVLARGLAGLLLHDAGVRTGQLDAVHQLRVTCRRLRSELQALHNLHEDPRITALREELAWLAGELGEARDLEVLRVRLARTATQPERISPLPLDAILSEQQVAAGARAVAALDDPRHLALIALVRKLLQGVELTDIAHQPCRKVLTRLQRSAQRHLDEALQLLDGSEAEEVWHDVRKRAKRTRYVGELVASVLGGRAGSKRARRLQDQLGAHNDAAVAVERLQVLAQEHPEHGVLCGRLIERERAAAAAIRRTTLAGLA